MTNGFNIVGSFEEKIKYLQQYSHVGNVDSSDVSLFGTNLLENERTTFDETFFALEGDNKANGEEFLTGLTKYKSILCDILSISSDEYDSLSCIALALATQETGMGLEEGYVDENEGFGKFKRTIKKFGDVVLGGKSASSGLTQLKIYDFMTDGTLSKEEVKLLKTLGVKANGINNNNLYENADLAAASTIVVLNNINDNNYEKYLETMQTERQEIRGRLDSNLSDEECYEKGKEAFESLLQSFNDSYIELKPQVRDAISNWIMVLSEGEQKALKELNDILVRVGNDLQMQAEDLDYMRYYFSDKRNAMTRAEYMIYAWNKGTGPKSFQLDRMMNNKVCMLLDIPELFAKQDMHGLNTTKLAYIYAQELGLNKNFMDRSIN